MSPAVIESVSRQLGELRHQLETHVDEAVSMVAEVERTAGLMKNLESQSVQLRALIARTHALRRSAIAQRDALRTLRASIRERRRSLR